MENVKDIILVCGPPCSLKTTYSRQLEEDGYCLVSGEDCSEPQYFLDKIVHTLPLHSFNKFVIDGGSAAYPLNSFSVAATLISFIRNYFPDIVFNVEIRWINAPLQLRKLLNRKYTIKELLSYSDTPLDGIKYKKISIYDIIKRSKRNNEQQYND